MTQDAPFELQVQDEPRPVSAQSWDAPSGVQGALEVDVPVVTTRQGVTVEQPSLLADAGREQGSAGPVWRGMTPEEQCEYVRAVARLHNEQARKQQAYSERRIDFVRPVHDGQG